MSSSCPLPPDTTPAPKPIDIFQLGMSALEPPTSTSTSTSGSAPTPSPIPVQEPLRDVGPSDDDPALKTEEEQQQQKSGEDQEHTFPLPRLRLRLDDLAHKGTAVFLSSTTATSLLATGVRSVLGQLYVSPSERGTSAPPTRSVTLILRSMGGVAYTTGADIDDDHKEIHLSLEYVASVAPARRAREITGVVVHELVHCFQWNGRGRCPGGLVEGVADWVRLRCGLAPPHWSRDDVGRDWDGGYQHTAYFLEYLESRFGAGTVRRINERLRTHRYEEKPFWTELLGAPVGQLWRDYKEKVKKGGKDGESDQEELKTDDSSGSSSIEVVDEATQT